MDSIVIPGDNTQNLLEELRSSRHTDPNYIIPEAEPKKTIILLGFAKVGKTTVANVIVDSLFCSNLTSYRQTQEQEIHDIGGLRVVDTPNIFGNRNRLAKLSIHRYYITIDERQIPLNNNIFPLLGLVFSIMRGINVSDINAIIDFQQKFSHFRSDIFLILSHCEEKTDEQRQQLLNEFFDNDQFTRAKTKDFFEDRVLLMGSIREESIRNSNRQALVFQHNQVLKMRAEFIRKCRANITNIHMPFPPVRSDSVIILMQVWDIINRNKAACSTIIFPGLLCLIALSVWNRQESYTITPIIRILEDLESEIPRPQDNIIPKILSVPDFSKYLYFIITHDNFPDAIMRRLF